MTAVAINAIQKKKFMLFSFKKTIVVEGHGNYEIEVTNVVNASTMEVQSVFPSLMSNTHQ